MTRSFRPLAPSILAALALALAFAGAPAFGQLVISPADAPAAVDSTMKTFRAEVMPKAQAKGSGFSAYDLWLAKVAGAIRQDLEPAKVKPAAFPPFSHPQPDIDALIAAAKAADQAIGPYIPPANCPASSFACMSGHSSATVPSSLMMTLLTRFHGQSTATRNAAAGQLVGAYQLPK